MALGLLFSGLSGAGKGLAASAEQDQRVADETKLTQERARLEEEKQLRIDEARRQRDRSAQVQQGVDIGAAVNQSQNQRDAEAINAKFGSTMSAEDAQALRTNPAARQAYGLLGSTRQSDLEDRANAAESLGYLDAARETRNALNTEVQNQRNKSLDENADKRLDAETKWRKDQADLAARQEDRRARIAEADVAFRKSQVAKADSRETQMAEREQRSATMAALKGYETDIKQLSKDAADPLLAPEQKRIVDQQIAEARAEASRLRKALAGAGLEGSEAPKKSFDPNDYRIGGAAPGRQAPAAQAQGTPQRVANPVAEERQQTPEAMAKSGLDTAISTTVRALTAATNKGDKDEAKRLNDLLQEQQRARARL